MCEIMRTQKKVGITFLVVTIISLFFASGLLMPYTLGLDVPFTMRSGWTSTAPTIDGTMETLWNTATRNKTWHIILVFQDSYVYFLNNKTHLFIYLDLAHDVWGNPNSHFYLWIDANNSKEITPAIFFADCFIGTDIGVVSPISSPSSLIYTIAPSFSTSPNAPWNHVQLEIAIDMRTMYYTPQVGDTIGFLLAYDTTADTVPDDYFPYNFYTGLGGGVKENDESTYAELVLGAPYVPPLIPPQVVLGLVWTFSIVLAVAIAGGGGILGTYLLLRYLPKEKPKAFPYKIVK
jgi:hypothetical protein